MAEDREVEQLVRRLKEFGWAWMGFETTGLAEAVERAAAARGIETARERIDDVGCIIHRVGSIDAETQQLLIVRRNDRSELAVRNIGIGA